jgi:succinoglycan biosynthesis transport protein ExoP
LRYQRNLPVLSVAVPTESVEYESAPQREEPLGLSLQQIYAMVWAHRRLTLIIMLAVVLPTALAVKFLLHKTYTATATLMVNTEITNPLAGRDTNDALLANYMSTRVQLMKSSEVLMPVIQKLKLTQDKDYLAGFNGEPNALPDYVKDGLADNLVIEQGALGSQLLNVTASARDPVKAAQIANTVSEIYADQELRRQSGPATERAMRYSQELAELKAKVSAAQEQVTAFRQRTGVTTDFTAQNSNQNDVEAALLATMEQRYQDTQSQRRAAEVKAVADQSVNNGYMSSGTVNTLKANLASLESQLAQLSTTLGPQHPKVIELKSQIAATRKSLAIEMQSYASSANSDLSSLRQLEAKLKGAVEEQRQKVLNMRRLQDEGAKYVVELESAQSVYKRALDGYDEIMFAAGGHTTNVTFVSRAVPPLKAAKPNKVAIFLMSIVGGLGLGLVLPTLYELFFQRRVRCADDLERAFAIPVLVELSEIPSLSGAV